MSDVAAHSTREEKEKWLLRPIHLGGETALIAGSLSLLMMFDQNVSWDSIAIVATAGLLVASGFILWGIRRIMNAARGL